MKVIGKIENKQYICEVSHRELEKLLNLYYNKMEELKVGDEIDLGKGYDFMNETKEALSITKKFIDGNKKVIESIFNGINVMNEEG